MYCRNCGFPIQQGANMCSNCGTPAGAGTAFCPNCAAQTNEANAVCPNCGTNLTVQSYQPYQNYAQPTPGYNYQQPGYQQPPVAPPGYAQKSKLAAGLLGIFLGYLGVHNFYLGYTSKAVAQLLLSLLTCGIGLIGTSIWGLVEGIMILTGSITTDADGIPLKD